MDNKYKNCEDCEDEYNYLETNSSLKIKYVINQYQLTIPRKERKIIRDKDIILSDKSPIKIDEYTNEEKAFQELDLLVPTEEVVGNNRIFKTFALIKIAELDSGANYFNGDYYTRNF